MNNKEDQRYELARKKVERKKKFYANLNIYLAFSIFFFLLNLFTSPGRWWFIFPVLGWGIGIVSDYIKIFGPIGFKTDEDWEKQALEEELRKLGIHPEEDNKTKTEPEQSLELKPLQKRYEDRDLV
jgi:hypothetical protein